MKLLLDAMGPPSVARQLRESGHDAICVVEVADLRTETDEAVFAFAQVHGRIVVTEDAKDFRILAADLLRAGETHCGLILTTPRSFPRHVPRTFGRLASALDALLTSTEDLEGREVWLRPI